MPASGLWKWSSSKQIMQSRSAVRYTVLIRWCCKTTRPVKHGSTIAEMHGAADTINEEQHVHSFGLQSASFSILYDYSDIFGGAVLGVSFRSSVKSAGIAALPLHSRSRFGTGKLRSYFEPPGAVGGLYGSGCFHFSSKASVSWRSA